MIPATYLTRTHSMTISSIIQSILCPFSVVSRYLHSDMWEKTQKLWHNTVFQGKMGTPTNLPLTWHLLTSLHLPFVNSLGHDSLVVAFFSQFISMSHDNRRNLPFTPLSSKSLPTAHGVKYKMIYTYLYAAAKLHYWKLLALLVFF